MGATSLLTALILTGIACGAYAVNDTDFHFSYDYLYAAPDQDPTLAAYNPNPQCRRTNEWCKKFGGACAPAGTCKTVELRWKCSNQGKGKPKCVCCAKKQSHKCKRKTLCKNAVGFCTFRRTACDAVGPGQTLGQLIKNGCRCKGKKKGHCCIPKIPSDTTSTTSTTITTTSTEIPTSSIIPTSTVKPISTVIPTSATTSTTTSKTTSTTTTSTTTTMTTTEPKLPCSINSIQYNHNHVNNNYCFILRCDNGTWINDGIPGPSRCQPCAIIENAQIVQTFDISFLLPYSQKECSFSTVQEGNSTTPAYYIYVNMFMEPISVEYKEDGLDTITCTDVTDINSCSTGVISDIPEEVQPGVFAFSYNGLGLIMGPTLTVQFNGASFISYVPNTSKGSGTLGGFCGNYNGNADDDKTLRDGTPSLFATAITESWAVGAC